MNSWSGESSIIYVSRNKFLLINSFLVTKFVLSQSKQVLFTKDAIVRRPFFDFHRKPFYRADKLGQSQPASMQPVCCYDAWVLLWGVHAPFLKEKCSIGECVGIP